MSWDGDRDRRPHRHGSHREPGERTGGRQDADRARDRTLHQHHHGRRGIPRSVVLHHRDRPRLQLARRRHLPHRNHRRERPGGSARDRHGQCS